ncbi:MAG: ABC transporter ATP-binding protein [Clostridia bacterium]|nr:ABC transporter ATP-binding protein [Clostridia bacterium]
MALLTLKDIGKIYVSDGNVAVGIRGVNLSFDRGEFVAVTGKSGSGKSTLLNVISGMDTYEEGELYIEGESTSHYLQPDWETYREKYISFIFQDYNIIESFTVLQNVELALMHIEDKAARRRRALELLDRVGLTSHLRQKGSQLSGGQKQRTVIARALAKDSPIILADEPTGNLDSVTSAEIIELLREVSRDKLVIVVTHNFDQLKEAATRHIRIFDGAVESDHVLRRKEADVPEKLAPSDDFGGKKQKTTPKKEIRNGFTLGRAIFVAKPRLSAFLCLLLVVGTLGVFLVTSLCGGAGELFDDYHMFTPIKGRVVMTKKNGEPITDGELAQLVTDLGAQSYLHYDMLLDTYDDISGRVRLETGEKYDTYESIPLTLTYREDFGSDVLGRYPEAMDEVFLYLPISHRPIFGKDELLIGEITITGMNLKITGVKYYYDNNLKAKCLFTAEGFRLASARYYAVNRLKDASYFVEVIPEGETTGENVKYSELYPSFTLAPDRMAVGGSADYKKALSKAMESGENYTVNCHLQWTYVRYDYYYVTPEEAVEYSRSFDESYLVSKAYSTESYGLDTTYSRIICGTSLFCDIIESTLASSYRQASLFFRNDREAAQATERLADMGYIAVISDTTYEESDAEEIIVTVLNALVLGILWLVAILFLGLFLSLCTVRTLGAFKGDMAIMRSMGIPVRVIRIGMYVRMLISLIPAFILVAVAAIVIFTSPRLNQYFVYLYAWQYALIALGMILLTVFITHRQIRKLFGESVKKSLKGGAAA